MKKWRLIISPPLDGTSNMAIDEAMFNLNSPPTIRFYSWKRPTLSLGRFQKIDSPTIGRCEESGINIVRRPTGGRAILHHFEVTFSVCAPYDDFPSSPTLKDIYLTLGKWQVGFLSGMGLDASLAGEKSQKVSYSKNRSCFLTSTPYEVMVRGKKICANAQKRGRLNFLQQGSLLIDIDRDLFLSLNPDALKSDDSFTFLRKENVRAGRNEIIKIMFENFSRILGSSLEEGDLFPEEVREKKEISEKMYKIAEFINV